MTEDEARQRVIRSMCPEKVCRVCGEPSRRITKSERVHYGRSNDSIKGPTGNNAIGNEGTYSTGARTVVTTLGWSDCGHDDWRPGIWLDPFGAAT